MATPNKKITNQAQIDAARKAEAERPAKLAEQQAKLPVVKQALSTAQSGARTTTGQTIFEKSLAGLPSSYNQNTDVARGMAAMSARYGLQAADLNAYTGANVGYNIAEQTKAEQGAVTTTENLIDVYGTPVDIPSAIYEEEKKKSTNVAYDTMAKILENYRITGLASVLESIRDEYPEASSEDILTLLQFDDRYNTKFNERFAANVDRLKAGKPVLSPADYLKLEQGYMKIFNAYNLPAFNTQFYYDTFIKGDLDIEEVTDRVQLGYDRVLNDQPVQTAFNQFFSALGFSDIVTGMLDTANQLPALERKVKAAEIGGAALRQGLVASELAATEAQANVGYTNVSRGTLGADVLGRQGLTKAQAEEGYKKIAQVLPTAEKLSSIYGGTEEQYGRLEAEQEQLQGLASAARKRQRLADIETAQFKKQSGLGKGALGSLTNI
jgi:hypothetical protein